MTTEIETSGYRRYEFYSRPRKLISSYALESIAPHIYAAKLSLDVLGLANRGDLQELEQVKEPQRDDISAQVVESLFVGTLCTILRWEKERPSDSKECCLPFVDVASDALAQTALEILTSDSKDLFPMTAAQVRAAFRKASSNDDDSLFKLRSRSKFVIDLFGNIGGDSIRQIKLPITTTIYFGDGQIYKTQNLQGAIDHVYTCSQRVCYFEAKIEAQDARLSTSADNELSRLTVVVNN